MARLVHCAECGRNKLHKGKGLCRLCYNRQWREENPEYFCQYYRANRERRKAESRVWNAANATRKRESSRQWYIANCERAYKYSRQWRKANPNKANAINYRYREKHRDKVREWARKEYAANPERGRAKVHRRRAMVAGATIGLVDEAAIYERDKVCIYCDATEDLTLDHLIPLARGGAHAQDNLAVACRSCNSKKGTKTYEEFVINGR